METDEIQAEIYENIEALYKIKQGIINHYSYVDSKETLRMIDDQIMNLKRLLNSFYGKK